MHLTFIPTKTVCGPSRVSIRHRQVRCLSSGAQPSNSPSCQPPPSVCVFLGWVPPKPLSHREPSGKEGKNERKRVIDRWPGMGRVWLGARGGLLSNPGSLLAFRARAETASPPGLTAQGQAQHPFKDREPATLQLVQAGSQAGGSSSGSQPRSCSSLSVPQSLPNCYVLGLLRLTGPDPIPSHLWPLQKKYPSCLGPRSLHFLLLQMGK